VFDLPNLAETSLSNNKGIVKETLFDFNVLDIFYCFGGLSYLLDEIIGGGVSELLFVFLADEMLGIFGLKAGLLLGVHEVVIGEFAVDMLEVEVREVNLGGLLHELVEGVLLARHAPFLVLGPAVLGDNGLL
jgi:hypothetical protein